MPYHESKLPIKTWAEEDRPREKLLLKGKSVLSDAELLAIIIGSGSSELSAVELSRQILASTQNDLNKLSKLTISDLVQFKGIGEAKAISIIAAMELGKRRTASETELPEKFTSSKQLFQLMEPILSELLYEEFWVLLLNRNNRMLSKHRVSSGGVAGTVVDAKIILNKALNELASGLVLFHNHPSGNLEPSQQDKDITEKIIRAGKLMDIYIVDHIIIAQRDYYSFRDNGLL